LSWFVKKQGAVTHSSSESEFLALDAGLRVTGIPTLILWEVIVSVFVPKKIGSSTPPVSPGKTSTIGSIADIIDFVPLDAPPHIGNIRLYILEDNEPVISMVKKGRCPTMRHLSRTSRISSDWLFERMGMIL
jgi:hypothetical protein